MPGREPEPGKDPEKVARADLSPSWLAGLEGLTSELSFARGPGEVAEAALSAGRAALGAESGAVLLQGGVGGGLEVLRVAGITEALLSRSTAGLQHSPVRQAWRTGTAVFLERPEEVQEQYPQFAAAATELPTGAIAALPLSAAGRLLGMLVLGFGAAHPFREEEREFALALARQVAQALERAQLFVSAQAARAEALSAKRRLSFLESVSLVLTDTFDERALCTRVVDLAVPTLCDWAAVFAKEEGGPPALLASSGPRELGDRAVELLASDREGRLALSVDGEAWTVVEAAPGDAGSPLAVALAPLGARGQAFGALALASADPQRRYGPEDQALFSDLARRMALALEHARLDREVRSDARAMEDFMHVASHELRGPLSAMQLAVQLLARDLERDHKEKASERIRLLERQAERLNRLSEALLDVSRIDTGQLTLVREELDLSALARDVMASHLDEAQAAGVVMEVDARGRVPCLADPERVEQVLSNLLSNALKYGRGTPVKVRVYGEEGYALLAVMDGGIGISKENQTRVFERFERLVPRSAGGLGLGLWIARGLVEAHGGRIEVQSAPGQGATFTVRLPRGGG